jgi:geranylgeranyl pyrophosphate synthase
MLNYDSVYTILRYFFQIRDDYINLTDVKYWMERGFCQDFDKQKISYLITYCFNYELNNYEQINLLVANATKTKENKIAILKLMSYNGLFTKIYILLLELKQSVLNTIDVEIIFQQ